MRVVWLLLALLLVTGLALYQNPDYKEQLLNLSSQAGISKQTTRVYKWRNARGEWQLTGQPPAPDIEYEKLEYREDVNVLPLPHQLGGK
ncbi:MAG: hypothetical protein U9P11_05410 [Pseudomonadota bacterium]|nr:hypothetical protein [Pseudomonadota bacterium]